MTVPGNIDALLLGGLGGYQIERSLRFNSPDTAYLSKIVGAGGGTTKNAVSFWVKRSALGTQQALFQGRQDANNQQYIGFTTSNAIELGIIAGGSYVLQKITSAVYRDASAWYHVFFYQDNTLATAEDRYQLYINGVRVTAWSTNTNTATQSNAYYFGSNVQHYIAAFGGANTLDGYLTEFHFIYQPTTTPLVGDFGETDTITGVWKPKKYAGTYGTNGFYLKFADNSGTTSTTLGKDSSGNGNNWTPNNFSVTAGAGNDSMIDVPTPYADGGNGRGNYATLSPLSKGDDATLSNGNLDISYGSASFPSPTMATFGMSSGKWYWETTITASSIAATAAMLGVTNISNSSYNVMPQYPGYNANGWAYHGNNGSKYTNGSATAYGNTYGVNDVIGCAFDADTGKIWWSKNGTWQASGDPAAGTNAAYTGLAAGTYYPAVGDGGASQTFSASHNFGQRPFAYTPPSGFLALNTQNLPEPSIKKPNQWMDATTYTGTGANQTIVNSGAFQPDLVWIKSRSAATNHRLVDAVRGNNYLVSNSTAAEVASGTMAIQSNGFLVGTDSDINNNAATYVGWQWKESATPGFDIVTYTGTGSATTVAHNLGVAPKMIIAKNRTSASSWDVYHIGLTSANYRVQLNSTGAESVSNGSWNGTAPTSTVFSVKDDTATNSSGASHVAYLWSEVAGFSKFGSYTGNGSTDGPFVYCGFRPRWVMMKSSTNAATPWQIFDSARETFNTIEQTLVANGSNAEPYDTASPVDFLSNGFKLRGGGASYNNYNTGTWIFAAFAETPMKYSLAF